MARTSKGFEIRWNAVAFDDILNSPQLAALTKQEAERVAATARALAAGAFEYRKSEKTGRYEASITVAPMRQPSRYTHRVVANVPYALRIESLYGILSRALAANAI